MGYKILASIICQGSEWHLVDEELINPEFDNEGFLIGGYLGSAKDFCKVCEARAEVVWLRAE